MRLKNKVAVVTGAAHGMKAAETKLFTKETELRLYRTLRSEI